MSDVPLAQAKHLLVPVDGSPASMEAVGVACRLARQKKGTVYAIYIIEVDRTLPLDAELPEESRKGEEILRAAREAAKREEYEVTGEMLQCREAAQAIASEAVDRQVDAVILGVEYERPFGEYQLQRTAAQLLKQAPCQVWVCRKAPGDIER